MFLFLFRNRRGRLLVCDWLCGTTVTGLFLELGDTVFTGLKWMGKEVGVFVLYVAGDTGDEVLVESETTFQGD